MSYDQVAVIIVEDANPEQFQMVLQDSLHPDIHGMQLSRPFTQRALRANLAQMGKDDQAIDALIQDARK